MAEDTPESTPPDSHIPFMGEGNEDTDAGVGTNMDAPITPESEAQFPRDQTQKFLTSKRMPASHLLPMRNRPLLK